MAVPSPSQPLTIRHLIENKRVIPLIHKNGEMPTPGFFSRRNMPFPFQDAQDQRDQDNQPSDQPDDCTDFSQSPCHSEKEETD
jgi:hypothetical protein